MHDQPVDAFTTAYCLREYHPYRIPGGERNPAFVKATDGRMLDFKDGQPYAIKAERELISAALNQLDLDGDVLIMIVPGHSASASNAGKPLARVAEGLAAMDENYTAEVDGLLRTKDIAKLAHGGCRTVQTHLASMQVARTMHGELVVLLDDVFTTGNSIAAARQLLIAAGARSVAAVVMARTAR